MGDYMKKFINYLRSIKDIIVGAFWGNLSAEVLIRLVDKIFDKFSE